MNLVRQYVHDYDNHDDHYGGRRLHRHDIHEADMDPDRYLHSTAGPDCTYTKSANPESDFVDIKCNITETFRCDGNTTYQGFYGPCISGIPCPYENVRHLHDCEVLCSRVPKCRALAFRNTEKTCLLVDSSWRPLPEDPKHDTTGC